MSKITINKEEWLAAIADCCGMVTLVADRLKISRITLAKYRDTTPWVDKAFKDSAFRCTDLAEKCLLDEIPKNWKAAAWYLERKAKERGYGKELKIESDDKPGVMHLYFPDDGRDKPDPSNPEPTEPTEPAEQPKPTDEQHGQG